MIESPYHLFPGQLVRIKTEKEYATLKYLVPIYVYGQPKLDIDRLLYYNRQWEDITGYEFLGQVTRIKKYHNENNPKIDGKIDGVYELETTFNDMVWYAEELTPIMEEMLKLVGESF